MVDQLRWDYLGYAGNKHIHTPNLDDLASRGVNFTNTFVQGTVCGSSRASFYTGRYVSSHGATYNNYPLRVDEWTLGDYMAVANIQNVLVGKTHMRVLQSELERLGIDPGTDNGVFRLQAGFEPFERDDGLHPDQVVSPDLRYNRILRENGFDGANPWHTWANSADGPNGEVLSGWYMRNARLPARIPEQLSETAYITNRAMDFIKQQGQMPWCLHLSYIKPHWPYMAPRPYHEMYGVEDIKPANAMKAERENPHPLFAAYRRHKESVEFSRPTCRDAVIPTYMGLISQLDHHIGRFLKFLQSEGYLEDTLIVFTSDHGDYLGDHWLGEKEMFYESALRIPLIVVDPRIEADKTRGSTSKQLVESIDLIPTFMDAVDTPWPDHILEGKSLLPALHGGDIETEAVFSEFDYSLREARNTLGVKPLDAKAYMVRTRKWKYAHYPGFVPQLFDLENDPEECHDLGTDPGLKSVRDELHLCLHDWHQRRIMRVGISEASIEASTGKAGERGYLFGAW